MNPIDRLTQEFERFPGIGPRQASPGGCEVGGGGHVVQLLDVVDTEPLDQGVLERVGRVAALLHPARQPQRAGPGEGQPGLGPQAPAPPNFLRPEASKCMWCWPVPKRVP